MPHISQYHVHINTYNLNKNISHEIWVFMSHLN
jgi:hypothetical protein